MKATIDLYDLLIVAGAIMILGALWRIDLNLVVLVLGLASIGLGLWIPKRR